jgi:hypothetical protein
MFRKTITALAVLSALALAGCGHPNYASEPDGMMQHRVSYIGI